MASKSKKNVPSGSGKPPGRIRRAVRFLWKWTWRSVAAFVVLSFLWVLLYRWIHPPCTYLMAKRKVEAWKSGAKDTEIHYDWVDWSEMSGAAPLAMMAAEDQKLPFHHGFDFESISKAVEKNKAGKRIRGGSTISQQVAKNAFLWPGRSWVRKGFEAWFTMLIEVTWPKRRILEVYCNIAETGERTFGVEAASQRYLGKPASKLSMSEGALVAAVLPNPRKFSIEKPSGYVRRRQGNIRRYMTQLGGTDYLKALDDPDAFPDHPARKGSGFPDLEDLPNPADLFQAAPGKSGARKKTADK